MIHTDNDFLVMPFQLVNLTSGSNHNISINSSIVGFIPAANNDTITGVAPDTTDNGGLVFMENASQSGYNLKIKDSDSGSATENQFHLGLQSVLPLAATTLTLKPGEAQLFYYTNGYGWTAYRTGTFT